MRSKLTGAGRMQIPAHAYHSSAYYAHPNRHTMVEKEWLGADLIFDLDADHLQGSEGVGYKEMLEMVKDQTRKLLDDFVLSDFGFDPQDVHIAFSGGRGYHIHVTEQSILSIGAAERRELVDYITGRGVEWDRLLLSQKVVGKQYGDRMFSTGDETTFYPTETGGWRGKMGKGIVDLVHRLEGMERDEVIEDIRNSTTSRKVGRKEAGQLFDVLFEGERGKRQADRLIKSRNLEVFPNNKLRNIFLSYILDTQRIDLSGETDEPVTADVKRLIRLGGSLHGKTGFKVVSLNRDELDDFEPLRDALAFGDRPIKVNLARPMDVELGGARFREKEGETELPEYAAVFGVCQKMVDRVG